MQVLINYWWAPALLAYFAVAALLIRRSRAAWERFFWATMCWLILTIPGKPPVAGYLLAGLVVVNLFLYWINHSGPDRFDWLLFWRKPTPRPQPSET